MKKMHTAEHVLIVHPDPGSRIGLIGMLEKRDFVVTALQDSTAVATQTNFLQFDIIYISNALRNAPAGEILKRITDNPLTAGIPVIILTQAAPAAETTVRFQLAGADAVAAESADPELLADLAVRLAAKQKTLGIDPVSHVLSGPLLDCYLERLCSKNNFSWHFLLIKLLSLKAINLHYGYDAGDELMAALAAMIKEEILSQGAETDFVGRLYGTRFCAATRARSIDSVCRNIITKSGRVFRKFYTPFEWMKGYLTVESGKHAGNYHLCDIVIAALQIPAGWGNNRAYLLDIADEVLMQIPKTKQKYIIVNP